MSLGESTKGKPPELFFWGALEDAIRTMLAFQRTDSPYIIRYQFEMFRIWYKKYGADMITEIRKNMNVFGTMPDKGAYEFEWAAHHIEEGLDTYQAHDDAEYLREQVIDAISRLYFGVTKGKKRDLWQLWQTTLETHFD